MTSEKELFMDYPFLLVFDRADLAAEDKAAPLRARRGFTVNLDGQCVGLITKRVDGYSPAFDLADGKRIGPSFNPDALRKRVIRQAFNGDVEAFSRATVKKIGG